MNGYRGVRITKNRLAIIFAIMVFLLALIPTALGLSSSKTSSYLETDGLNSAFGQSKLIVSNFQQISNTPEKTDLNKKSSILVRASSTTSQYQDVQWLKLASGQSAKLSSDFKQAVTALNHKNYKEIYNAGYRIQVDSGNYLKQSKKYKVSPKLKNAKSEYESALSDYQLGGKYMTIAANKQKAGDVKGTIAAYNSAANYINAGNKHLTKSIKYLKT